LTIYFRVWTRRFAFTLRRKSSKRWSATFLTGKFTRVSPNSKTRTEQQVMKYQPFAVGEEFSVKHLRLKAARVNP
jgi:hypothetical protein